MTAAEMREASRKGEVTKLVLPDRCECCGALLQGGATVHREGCVWLDLIEKHFPGYQLPEREND